MPTPIQIPSGYTTPRAVAFADTDGSALIVSAAVPMPVTFGIPVATPLAATTAATTQAGPYQPALGRGVVLTLSGAWTGTVKVLRSTDGGTTKQPLTVAGDVWGQFTGNACEAVWEESEALARLYLDITLTSGSLTYRLAQ